MPLLRKRRGDATRLETFSPGWEVPARFNFTRDVVDALADDPTRSALTFVDAEGIVDRRSFAEVSGDAARWAHMLRTRLDRGDRVLVMLGKSPAWHGAMLGALKGGLVAVPCPDMLRARDIAFRVRHSGARLVVAERSCEIEVEEMRNQVESTVAVLYLDEARSELSRYMPVAPTEDTTAGETALILYTSGTTKDPKGVVHTHAYTWAQRMQASHWLDAHEKDVVWCTAGTGWAKAIWNVLLGPWSHGAEVVVHEGAFDPEQRLALLQKLGITVLCQAPTEYRMLAKLERLAGTYLPRLRHAVSAGEPLNPEVIERFQDALGLTIYDGYGQTENSLLVANTAETPIRPGSMGLPTPGHDVAVIDDAGHVCAPGEEGDLALIGRPPTLFTGYWEAPDDTEATFRDGWYVTGDRAVRDEDGYLWFVGRADDVILSAAYRIGPFEVESALLEHPAVAESAVVGVPDPDRGQLVKAFVVLRPGHEPGGELAAELQEHVKAVTAPYKYPRAISFVDELPKTSSGKIRRVELRENPDIGSLAIVGEPVASLPRSLVEENGAHEAAREAASAAAARDEAAETSRRRLEAELAARREAEAVAAERARAAAEAAAHAEAEEQMRYEAEEAARRDAEEARAQAEAEEAVRREADERARAEAEERARADAEEAARREAEEARARVEAEDRARVEAEAAARREAEEARARAEAEERERLEAEERARTAAEERERLEAEERARTAAEERERREAEERAQAEAEEAHARAEAEEAARRDEEARARAEADERARVEMEAAARREAEAQELARREAEEAELREAAEAERREAEAAAAAAAAAALELEAATVGDVTLDDAEPETDAERRSWRAARQARKEEAARAKREAEEAKQREKEAEEQRKREEVRAREEARLQAEADKAAAKQRAKDEVEQRKRDEAEAKQRAKDEVEQRKRDEIEAKQRAKDDAEQRKRDEAAAKEDARRRELEAQEAARQSAEAEKAEARQREEEERRLKKVQAKARRRRGLFDQPEEEPLAPGSEPEAPIPDIVERLRRYSNKPVQPSASEDEPAER
jgi:acetyl-CoA synthetase/medium-chain acyl-CoA synthetase